ncbi:hypothetical protein Tco_1168902, partial [Tanacetum coccineum]
VRETSAAKRIEQMPSIHAISQQVNSISSEFGQNLVNKSQSALSKGAHVCRALKNRVITKHAYASVARSKIMAQEPIHAQNIDLDKNVRSHHIFNSIIQGGAIRKTSQEKAVKEKTTTAVEDAEENSEETADVEQAFNNLSTMLFLNISTRSKTTQTAKGNTKTVAKRLEDLQKENN